MGKIVTSSTQTNLWRNLVRKSASVFGYTLKEEMEAHLVFLLIRFLTKVELEKDPLAIQHLKTSFSGKLSQKRNFSDLGDKCLLLSGFFPENTTRKNVSADYFTSLGKSSYYQVSMLAEKSTSEFYLELCSEFIHLTNILLVMNKLKLISSQFPETSEASTQQIVILLTAQNGLRN